MLCMSTGILPADGIYMILDLKKVVFSILFCLLIPVET